jgi:phospholipid/cholesterol/gamma-HCH transport system ATP-binding protein
MRKRAALARVIVYRPKIILYDEPTTGLDPITSDHINQLIKRTKKELNSTTIVVTHDIQSALVIGDRLAFHLDGKIPVVASPEEFLKSENPEVKKFLLNALISKEELLKQRTRSTQ